MTKNSEFRWRKSSFSGGANGACFELAPTDEGVVLRNSNRLEAGIIPFTTAELQAFIAGVKAGEFDDLI